MFRGWTDPTERGDPNWEDLGELMEEFEKANKGKRRRMRAADRHYWVGWTCVALTISK
jgi:hypothetical protein